MNLPELKMPVCKHTIPEGGVTVVTKSVTALVCSFCERERLEAALAAIVVLAERFEGTDHWEDCPHANEDEHDAEGVYVGDGPCDCTVGGLEEIIVIAHNASIGPQ